MDSHDSVLTKKLLVKMAETDKKRGVTPIAHGCPALDRYSSITDDAADYLASFDLSYCSMTGLRDVSDKALKRLASIPGIEFSGLIRGRLVKSRVSLSDLQKHGFFKYVDKGLPPVELLSYGGEGAMWPYQVTDQAGTCISVGRSFGADIEELPLWGITHFLGNDGLAQLGLRVSEVCEISSQGIREWRCGNRSYPIAGHGIDDSAYSRAAFALVAILNQMLAENGSDESAYGVGEGNDFCIVFLTKPLRNIISKVADALSKPISQQHLMKSARADIKRSEPPLMRQTSGGGCPPRK